VQAPCAQATPLAAGVGVAAAAFIGREVVKQYIKFRAAPAAARAYYKVSTMPDVCTAQSKERVPMLKGERSLLCMTPAASEADSAAVHAAAVWFWSADSSGQPCAQRLPDQRTCGRHCRASLVGSAHYQWVYSHLHAFCTSTGRVHTSLALFVRLLFFLFPPPAPPCCSNPHPCPPCALYVTGWFPG
jgi:hypothetical protein